jgi:AraC family transcriptional activator of tynA and feaB
MPSRASRPPAWRAGWAFRSAACTAAWPKATTFATALAGFRMQAAQRMLADARFDRLSVAQIGFRVGLADASHFVRQCSRHLGATPGVLRSRR